MPSEVIPTEEKDEILFRKGKW